MDPEAALKEAREAADAFLRGPYEDRMENAERLASAFEALDEWLSMSGFKPAEWAGVALDQGAIEREWKSQHPHPVGELGNEEDPSR